MNRHFKINSLSFALICVMLFTTSIVFAGSGSPTKETCLFPPCGLATQGDAGGTKLTGLVSVYFTDTRCEAGASSECPYGDDLVKASVTIYLKKSGGNYDAKGGVEKEKVEFFDGDLGDVPNESPMNIFDLQQRIEADFNCLILERFFDVPKLECDLNDIVLKSIGAENETEPDDDGYYYSMAEVTLAVKERND